MSMRTPRVNSALLAQYQGKTVRLTGKVLKLEGDTATVEASDQGQVTVRLNRDSNFADAFVEVVCKVTGDTSVSELTSYNLGDNIDMSLVEAVVQAGLNHPELFTSDAKEDQYMNDMY